MVEFYPGDTVGRFRLTQLLGEGGSGQVWQAEATSDLAFQKTVALKLLHSDARKSESAETLLREARLGANLRHPNIVDVLEVGQHDGGVHVAMEFVDGGSLDRLILETIARADQLPLSVIADIGVGIARGLSWAHNFVDESGNKKHIVHRDLKPANILLSRSGVPKIADFGIARVMGASSTSTTGTVRGTPAYLAPELWEADGIIRRASDMFSLGCILWELAALSGLFDKGTIPKVYGAIGYGNPAQEAALIADSYPELAPIVERLLERSVEDRWDNADEVATELSRLSRPTEQAINLRGILESVVREPSRAADLEHARVQHRSGSARTPLKPGPSGSIGPKQRTRRWMLVGSALLLGAVGVVALERSAPSEMVSPETTEAAGPEATEPPPASSVKDVGGLSPVPTSPVPAESVVASAPPARSRSSVSKSAKPSSRVIPPERGRESAGTERRDRAAASDRTKSSGASGSSTLGGEACLILSSSPGGARIWLDDSPSPRPARSRPNEGFRRPPGRVLVGMGGSRPAAQVEVVLVEGQAAQIHCDVGASPTCKVTAGDLGLCL